LLADGWGSQSQTIRTQAIGSRRLGLRHIPVNRMSARGINPKIGR
jgi:hypothetical protein